MSRLIALHWKCNLQAPEQPILTLVPDYTRELGVDPKPIGKPLAAAYWCTSLCVWARNHWHKSIKKTFRALVLE